MNRTLVHRILLFAGIFVPLHVSPPMLSDARFAAALGATNLQWIGMAYHLGFALCAAIILVMRGTWVNRLISRWRLAALMACCACVASTHASVFAQGLGRLAQGVCGAVLLAAFYRGLKSSGSHGQLPAIFGVSALILESGGLCTGLAVSHSGFQTALWFILLLSSATLLLAIASSHRDPPNTREEPARVDLSGSVAFMIVAVLAYAGFFLMLLSLGSLSSLPDGPVVSGFAIFSTAFAFSSGNLLPLERNATFKMPHRLVSTGVGISVMGSIALWWAIDRHFAAFIVFSTAVVAFGNGVTISRCFQQATLVSSDGFSGSLLTMTAVMIVTVVLSAAANLLVGSFQMMQIVAFTLALMSIAIFGGGRALGTARL